MTKLAITLRKGAWPWAMQSEFLRLTADLSELRWPGGRFESGFVALADLVMTPQSRAGRATEQIRVIRTHDVYAHLSHYAGFSHVEAERKQLSKSNAIWGEPYGEARLLHYVAMLVGSFDPRFRPKQATLAQQRVVQRTANRLSSLLIPGAQPDDVIGTSDLRRLLKHLDAELTEKIAAAERSKSRPARADADAAQRYWLVTFCRVLIESFGEASRKIVSEVAGMIGYSPDAATVSRYIKKATSQAKKIRPLPAG